MDMAINWKVKAILEAHGITPYKLRQESGLSVVVTYAIANNEHQALDTGVIEKLIPALRRLTGDDRIQIGDVVEYQGP
jgi:DNA-binding Xre family transcriptional regulator